MYRFFLLIFFLSIFYNPLFSQENTENKSSHFALKVKETKEEKKKKVNFKKLSLKNAFVNTNFNMLIGATQFFGDIKQYDHLPAYEESNGFWEIKPSLEVSLTKKLSPLLSLQGTAIIGQFGGVRDPSSDIQHNSMTDPYNQYEGEGDYFLTNYKELDLQLLLNLSNTLSFFSTKIITNNYTLYLKGGMGINVFNAVNRNLASDNFIYAYGYKGEEESWELSEMGETKKDLIDQPKESVYILGLLAKYEINDKFSLIFDITKRTGRTDKWDAFNEDFNSRTASEYDNFNFYSLGASYNIGGKLEKEEWVTPLEGLEEKINIHEASIEWISEDKDNDGVADAFDKEPNTPVGVAVDGSGASLDIDMDNVPDYLDSDPFSSRGAIVDANGVEFDTDNDGIPDSKDLESNTEIGSIVNQYGISVSSSGANSDSYSPSIYFESGSYYINNSNLKRLATIAIVMNNNPNIRLNVIGNADNIGTSGYNQKLALNRANEVINFLSKNFDIDKNRFTAISNGEEKPLSKDEVSSEFLNINTLSINRRVDFQIIR